MKIFQSCFSLFILSIFLVCLLVLLSTDSVVAQPCQIEVIKNADPADNTPFEFTRITTGDELDFTLMDPDDQTMMVGVSLGQSTITENVPDGWAISSIQCSVDQGSEGILSFSTIGSTVNVNCTDFEGRGTCTFNNVPATRNVPTLSQWGLILMIALLGIIGIIAFRKKPTTE